MKSTPYDAIPPCGFRKMHANAPESLRHRCVCERIPGTPPRPDGPVPIGFPHWISRTQVEMLRLRVLRRSRILRPFVTHPE